MSSLLRQVIRRYEAFPAVLGSVNLSYGELWDVAAKKVESLERMGAKRGSAVAIECDSSAASLVSLVACYSAEFIPVLIGSEAPESVRTGMRALGCCTYVCTDQESYPISSSDARGLARHLGYVVFTSGSSGTPKAVAVSQSALVARLSALRKRPGFHLGEKMLALTAVSFDISLAELLLPILTGGTVVATSPNCRRDPRQCMSIIDEYLPDLIQATPSSFRLLLTAKWRGSELSRLWSGGEVLTSTLAEQLLARSSEVWNLYGPSEATIWATAGLVESGAPIVLGSPLGGTRVELRTSDGSTPGVLEEGEIVLSGEGIADGYLPEKGRPKARGFSVGPFGWEYSTGDIARRDDQGRLSFVGRRDDQIKLRGHRIELSHVESVLEKCEGVTEIAVVVRFSGSMPQRLDAFVSGSEVDISALRHFANLHLASPPMRPSRYVQLSVLPRTSSGKIDRATLANWQVAENETCSGR